MDEISVVSSWVRRERWVVVKEGMERGLGGS